MSDTDTKNLDTDGSEQKVAKRDPAQETMDELREVTEQEYKWGFVTDIESESFPKGLGEETIRALSAKKEEPEFMTEWRLQAFRAWQKMDEPKWPHVSYPEIDFQDISYYSAPKQKKKLESLD